MKTQAPLPVRQPPPRSARVRPTPPRERAFDHEYWVTHCEGFRVDAAAGRLGFVEEVEDNGPRRPATLVVRAGPLGRRLLLLPVTEVAFIVPRAGRIWLKSPVSITGSRAAP